MIPRALAALVGLCVAVAPAGAQRVGGLQPTVFAITGARVVPEPGKTLEKATVVIRDGLVEAVGADVEAPADALVIDGKGLTVYAGFLDGMSNWGYDEALRRSQVGEPAGVDFAAEALAATKPDNRKGLTPEFRVSTALKADNARADGYRQAGFTAHLVAPDGSILVGQGALVSLGDDPPREAVLRADVAQHLAFRNLAGEGYPRSLMGMIAHARQTFLDAGHYQRLHRAFEDSGRVGRRPPLDPALAALGPALAGEQPVIFEADSADEIHRALNFAREFKLRPILYGGEDAWKVVERLKEEKVPVILRVDFAEEAASRREENLPERVKEDQERQRKEREGCAAVLHNHGVAFAFSTQGLSGDKPAEKFRENLRAVIAAGLPEEAALAALTSNGARILGAESQLGRVAPRMAAHLTVTDGDFHKKGTQVRYVFIDGERFVYDAKRSAPEKKEEEKPADEKPAAEKPREEKKEAKNEPATELEEDRKPKVRTGGNVLLRGATVLTVTKGTLPEADVLILEGKIAKLGKGLSAPEGVKVIEAAGMFVMPGVIDTHCHFAVSGGVNEYSLSVVPEVRVRDVISSEDTQIYRALAGGVTTARLLHGSANVIGGQDAVLKMKYGRPASELLVPGAPRGVKFALGENVKRTDGRFPNTRLGVEAVLVRAFSEARAYEKLWQEYEKAKAEGKVVPEPRRDLRLEALVDVLNGDLKVHCHCYRADEILMLLRVADRFGFKVQSLQHVLEGYKIAPEIAAHGASCSPFSDWWAYKIEAYDAIPFNAALLTEAGVSVCLKSDSNELMRHMYQEAAKCVKYGGLTEEQALATITINPARQLGLDGRIGSVEVGKEGDLAVFNGHPLNGYSRVEMTLVEGEVYFQRSEKLSPSAVAQAGPTRVSVGFKPISRARTGRYVLSDVVIHPVTGPAYEGTMVVEGGKIARLVRGDENVPAASGDVPVNGEGLHVYPGMIDAATVLGLTELGSAQETQDFAEGGDFQPDLRASVAINPDSALIPVTRANGVLSVVTRPTGSVVAGQGALINLAGWVPREMAVVDPLALHVEFPSLRSSLFRRRDLSRVAGAVTRRQGEERVRRLKTLFQQALAYDEARKVSPDGPVNPRLSALVPYAKGERPIVIEAGREDQIRDALKFADELKLRVILSGGQEAWKLADELKKRDVPVICGPVMDLPRQRHDPYDSAYACPARLHEAGVRFCIRSAGSTNTRNLPYEAAMAVSYGLPAEEGLKAATLYPAQILGVADQLGSIEEEKRANLVLANGDILQPSTQVLALFIDGRPLAPTSKHTELYDRYRERLHEVQEGRAPLGTR